MAQIAIVAVSYGNLENAYSTVEQARSALRLEGYECAAMIVDNMGQELGFDPQDIAIQRLDNPGFGAAINFGVRALRTSDTEAILCMSHDVVVDAKSVTSLIGTLQASNAGLVGPTLWIDDRISYGMRISRLSTTHLERPAPKVDALDGALIAVSISAWDAVGGYSEDYFLYWEDAELGVQAHRLGFDAIICPHAVAYSTSASGTGTHEYYSIRNAYHFRRDVYGRAGVPALCWLAVRDAVIAMRRLARLDEASVRLGRLRMRAMWDGLRDRRGPAPVRRTE